jgi:hypothetical protein
VINRRCSPTASLCAATLTFALLQCAHADSQGRPSAQVPIGPNITQGADATGGGNLYETQRIKRTVALDSAQGLDGKWDPLYTVQDGNGVRTTYLDWDDNYLYVAIESPAPAEARIDIDGQNDGWLRGADNLSLIVTPPADGSTDSPKVVAQRFDMAQNREQPVWAASPIKASDIQVAGGKTPRGTYALLLAIPNTETIGLTRKPGATFGIRIDSGTPKLPPVADEAVSIPVRPMLRVGLTEAVEANANGLDVKLSVNGPHDITPGGAVRTTLEIKNNGQAKKRLTRLFIRGTLNDTDFVDESKFAGVDIDSGQTIKRDLRSTVAPAAANGAVVLSGGGDVDDGSTVAALLAFNKVQPYAVNVETDNKPIPAGGENGADPVRTVKVFVRSRVNNHVTATINLKLPTGWKTVDGTAQKTVSLIRDGDVEFAKFQFSIPSSANLGAHDIGASVDVAGQTYTASVPVVIAQ